MKLADAPAFSDDAPGYRLDDLPARATPPRPPSHRLVVGIVFVVLVAAFAAHLAVFGSWIVDDAGISMAYAVNLAHGHGLVSQAGRTPVEGFSNPTWVVLLALLTKLGLFGRPSLAGLPQYVIVTKALAIVFHGLVLACLAVVTRRVLTVVRGTPPRLGVFLACWGATGLLLAANPSYVIWMGSGLENPLLAATVAAITAVATTAVPHPSARAMVGLGALAGVAALTRPDGAVYAVVVVAVPLLAQDATRRRRASLVAWGAVSFAGLFGAYLVFRLAYFGMLLPNTAVAKSQALPSIGNLRRIVDVSYALGGIGLLVAYCGCVAAFVVLRRNGNAGARRVLIAGLVPLAAALVTYFVLEADWMAELRFLTPAWPLLSLAWVLGAAQLIAVLRSRRLQVAVAVVIVALSLTAVPQWADRTRDFRADPTIPLCVVATRLGHHLADVARALGRDEAPLTVASPDIGGILLESDAHVLDLGGLVDRRIARWLKYERASEIARYVLDDARPAVIFVRGSWILSSGLSDERLGTDYVEVTEGFEWVRRDLLERTPDPSAALARIRKSGSRLDGPAPDACSDVLFG